MTTVMAVLPGSGAKNRIAPGAAPGARGGDRGTLWTEAYPRGPVVEHLALPDRGLVLQAFDGRLAGTEGGRAMRGRAGDDNRRLAGREVAPPVHDGDGRPVLAADLGGELVEGPHRHRDVGLVLEPHHAPPSGRGAHVTLARDDGSPVDRADLRHHLVQRDGPLHDLARRRPAGDRGGDSPLRSLRGWS